MTSFEPPPGRRAPGGWPPQQANPSWLGHVQPQDYRPAPGLGPSPLQLPPGNRPDSFPRAQPVLPPAATAPQARASAGVAALVLGGGVLAFVSLLLVLPYLLENTGPGGFVVGFVASLLPLGSVLLAVRYIDRWEPEPKRLLFFAFAWGALVSVSVTLLIQPFFSLAAGPASGLDY